MPACLCASRDARVLVKQKWLNQVEPLQNVKNIHNFGPTQADLSDPGDKSPSTEEDLHLQIGSIFEGKSL